jgi:predicted HicB family RNase H-like nuclease
VPFAVKLNGDLVKQLQDLAKERGVEMNALVAEVLQKGLAS